MYFKKIIFSISERVLFQFSTLLSTLLFTSKLTQEEFGAISVALTTVAIFFFITTTAGEVYSVKRLSNSSKIELNLSFSIRFISFLILLLLYFPIATIYFSDFIDVFFVLFLYCVGGLFVGGEYYFRAEGDFKTIIKARSVISIVFVLVKISLYFSDVILERYLYCLSYVIEFVIFYLVLFLKLKPLPRLKIRFFKVYVSYIFRVKDILLAQLVNNLYSRSDLIAFTLFFELKIVAVYALAIRFTSPLSLIVNSIVPVMFPILCSTKDRKKKINLGIAMYFGVLFFTLIAAMIVYLFIFYFFDYFFSYEYQEVKDVIPYYCGVYLASNLAVSASSYFNSEGHYRFRLKRASFSLLVFWGLAVLFVECLSAGPITIVFSMLISQTLAATILNFTSAKVKLWS